MDRGQQAYVLSRIRELLARKTSLEATGKEVGLGTTTVRKLADRHQFPRRKRFSPETRRQIRRDIRQARHTLSRLAELYRCAKSTISAYASEVTDEAGEFRPRALKQKRVCPTCQREVKVWPCVACASQGIVPHESALAK